MDVQEAVAEGTADGNGEVKKDGRKSFTMGPGDSLEGKLVYDGSAHVHGRIEGERQGTGTIDAAAGARVAGRRAAVGAGASGRAWWVAVACRSAGSGSRGVISAGNVRG